MICIDCNSNWTDLLLEIYFIICSINGGKLFEEPAVLEVKPLPVMAPAPVAVSKPVVAVPKKPTKDENLAKLKTMTSDFFAQM